MACACNRNRVTASGAKAVSGTYRVYVGDRKVYETTVDASAEKVAARFQDARIVPPGETA